MWLTEASYFSASGLNYTLKTVFLRGYVNEKGVIPETAVADNEGDVFPPSVLE